LLALRAGRAAGWNFPLLKLTGSTFLEGRASDFAFSVRFPLLPRLLD
jgi:hypothetical protein